MSRARIDKILSHEGFGTRKAVKKLLRVSEVLVNGKKVTDTGFIVNPDKDEIIVDGEILCIKKNHYIMMNKKPGVVSANKDGLHETVFDCLGEEFRSDFLAEKLHLVGRLDIDTEGLLLFTTDGALTHRVTSPKTHLPKSYFVRLEHKESVENQIEIFRKFFEGIMIPAEDNEPESECKSATVLWNLSESEFLLLKKEDRILSKTQTDGLNKNGSKACLCKKMGFFESENSAESSESIEKKDLKAEKIEIKARACCANSCVNECILTITEGKYHQVKRMFRAVGNKVVYLKRLSIGPLVLDEKLLPGEYRELYDDEIDFLIEENIN